MKNIKQVIVIRKDLGMRKGKMISQGAHASMKFILDLSLQKDEELIFKFPNEDVKLWMNNNFKKITVYVKDEQELLDIYKKAKEQNIISSLITDNGLTEFKGIPTNTCVAIGPCDSSLIDPITGHLNLL